MTRELIDYKKYTDQTAICHWPKPVWSTSEQHFKRIMKWVINRGIYPGPVVLNIIVHGHKSRNINGRETKWRREIMKELNIPLKRPYQTDMHKVMYGDYEYNGYDY